eukprot:TRINITY_DN29566_c0_g1_i2.p1 TRINITY_DN29566_c0_g1~~TRINITY_DN29566_c0_g1_i2.p1  ORF type:complete len:234 (+),score=51.95 TRINITY_DN29566_c0_g1_i2:84-785(+)
MSYDLPLGILGACCCTDKEEAEYVFQPTLATDEFCEGYSIVRGKPDQVLADYSAHSEGPAAAGKAAIAIVAEPTPAPEPPQSREFKEQEKVRLQQLVNDFARKAVKGCPCTYIRERSGERIPALYLIDKRLERLTVCKAEDQASPEVSCSIANIQDIYTLEEDGGDCFPSEVQAALTREEPPMLLMVVYQQQNQLFRFSLLEESRESRDAFLECLRVLCIYAQSAGSGAQIAS